MKYGNFLFSSESVTEGHPDKMADQISDSILDAALKDDPQSRVAIETFVTTGLVVVGGEMTTNTYVDIPSVVRGTLCEIGYDNSFKGFDYRTCGVISTIDKQSGDIAMGVDRDGAGDQGMMFGFACDETPELMPLPIILAHKLTRQLSECRKRGDIEFLRPDGKAQVTLKYKNWIPDSIDTIVVSSQHDPIFGGDKPNKAQLKKEHALIEKEITDKIIKPVIPPELIKGKYTIHINPTGRFVTGGPMGDTGLTGRKIIVDTYGGYARHGGGAFSGKDATKVDRSAAYMARYIAKNFVAAGFAKKLEIQLAYAIGVAEPVSIMAETFRTGSVSGEEIVNMVRKNFDLTPSGIIKKLGLRKPVFKNTAAYGHFGRDGFAWEKTDMVNKLHS